MTALKLNLPPGSLIHQGEKRTHKTNISLLGFNQEGYLEEEVDTVETLDLESKQTSWININGVHDKVILEQIRKTYDIHPLIMEDVMNTYQRPKAEEFEDHLFVTLKMISYNKELKEVDFEQVSFILGEQYVLSFQEKDGDIFNPIRERIRKNKGQLRRKNADYLLFALLDIVVDNYFNVLEEIGLEVDDMEEIVLENPPKDFLTTLHQFKRQSSTLRKSIFPLREAIGFIVKGESEHVEESTIKYYRDAYDHTISVIESVEVHREVLGSLKDIYLSSLSNKMNNIMKVLTIMASIFIPLTFIAGVYGMNFKNMPELNYEYGYYIVWGIMIVCLVGMLWWFKRKDWL